MRRQSAKTRISTGNARAQSGPMAQPDTSDTIGRQEAGRMSKEETISIEGTLLMLDDTTPHVAVPVQTVCAGKVIATTLSDERG